jgi:hypothetical protein
MLGLPFTFAFASALVSRRRDALQHTSQGSRPLGMASLVERALEQGSVASRQQLQPQSRAPGNPQQGTYARHPVMSAS